MSKIGKQPISVPEKVTVALDEKERIVLVQGPLGTLRVPTPAGVNVAITPENGVVFSVTEETKQAKSNWGTVRALVANAVRGVTEGFQKTLLLEGIGYRITKDGDNLTMSLGFSHLVTFKAPEGIVFEVEKNTILRVKGIAKAQVGQTAAEIRALRKPEPYKGKGFRYDDEVIRRKAGKKAGTAS